MNKDRLIIFTSTQLVYKSDTSNIEDTVSSIFYTNYNDQSSSRAEDIEIKFQIKSFWQGRTPIPPFQKIKRIKESNVFAYYSLKRYDTDYILSVYEEIIQLVDSKLLKEIWLIIHSSDCGDSTLRDQYVPDFIYNNFKKLIPFKGKLKVIAYKQDYDDAIFDKFFVLFNDDNRAKKLSIEDYIVKTIEDIVEG